MSVRQLSPEIVSLVHHVELNESGWWKKAVGQVVKGVLWKGTGPQTLAELRKSIRRELGLRLSDDVLNRQLDSLSSQGMIVKMPGPNYKLTESAFQHLSKTSEAALREQSACHDAFLDLCFEHCPELEASKVWEAFTKDLSHAIKVSGANLYHLLADGKLQKDVDWLANFISKFGAEEREGLRKVLTEFFAPGNHVCRNQVLRYLSAHFFAEAAQLRPETLKLIDSDRKTRTIRVILDTNFIFSVLKLHENPADDSALSLIELAEKSHGKLEIKLFVLPSTLDEAKRALQSQLASIERIRTTQAMSRAALTQPLSSIARRFFAAAAQAPGLTAGTFLQPYIDDLRTILLDKGIAVLEAHPSIYHQRQDVIDDVLDELRREDAELPSEKRKGYETLLHDVVLWHAVNDRRPADEDSPFGIEYWAVSIDWRLIAFDRSKRLQSRAKLPVVLHPSNLLQLIQFWVPRSPELEESLVDSIRLPLFFQSFDPEDERATVKVLESISRIQNVDDLPELTLKRVLTNRALRGRIRDSDAANDQVFELVREELLSVHKDVLTQLEINEKIIKSRDEMLEAEKIKREKADAAHADASKRAQIAEESYRESEKREQEREASDKQKNEVHAQTLNNAQRVAISEANRAKSAEQRLSRQTYIVWFYITPFIFGLLAANFLMSYIVTYLPAYNNGWKYWALVLAILIVPFCIGFIFSPHYVKNKPIIEGWWLIRLTHLLRNKLIILPVVTAFNALYQGGVWDGFKLMVGNLLS